MWFGAFWVMLLAALISALCFFLHKPTRWFVWAYISAIAFSMWVLSSPLKGHEKDDVLYKKH